MFIGSFKDDSPTTVLEIEPEYSLAKDFSVFSDPRYPTSYEPTQHPQIYDGCPGEVPVTKV